MNYEQVKNIVKNSPTIKILRSNNAALIISFLYNQFRENNEQPILNSTLVQKLADYIDELDYRDEEDTDLSSLSLDSIEKEFLIQLLNKPKKYLQRKL